MLTNELLKLYPYITKLDISNNNKITDINHLIHLRELCVDGDRCQINNARIKNLTNLTVL
jgi:hypothetical protein